MATDTRERLIRTAHDLFYSEGFHAVGLDRILAQVGVTKTTFYNHFDSKDSLVVESLRWHDDWWQSEFRRMLRAHGGDTPAGQLRAVPDAIDEVLHSDGFNGCIFINVAVEFPSPADPAHVLARQHKAAMVDILREIAGYAGVSEPSLLAEEIALLMEGSYVTRQVGCRDSAMAAMRRILTRVLEAYGVGDAA